MTVNYNKLKSRQLGINISTAQNRLRKRILFALVQETGKDICYRCSKKIEQIEELSIEHKIPWLYSEDPVEFYFDINNIAFSHLKCNVGRSRKGLQIAKCGELGATRYRDGCRCDECKEAQARKMKKYRAGG